MSQTTVRPNETVALGGASVTGAANAHTATSDDSDSSYVLLNGAMSILGFAEPSLPAGAIVTETRVRVRSAVVTTGLTLDLEAAGDEIETQFVNWTNPTTSTAAIFPGDGFVLADVELGLSKREVTANQLRVYEVYLDFIYVVELTVQISPLGTLTDINLPLIEWDRTFDQAGGSPTHFEVKVFTDAVVVGGGFDVDTTTPLASSGAVASSATSYQIDGLDANDNPLPNDDYQVFVRLAQMINGEQVWSDWDSEPFTVDTDAPGGPTVALVPQPNCGRMRIDLTQATSESVISDLYEIERSNDGGASWADIRTVEGGGLLGTPRVIATGTFNDTADGTTHNAVLPAPPGGIKKGDLLIAVAAFDGNPTVAWPSGWTEIKDEAGNGSAVRAACAWKRAVGGESGTITITTSASEGGAVRILCIRDAHPTQAPAISAGANGSAANSANPDSLDPSGWGAENTLWIAAMVNDGDVAVTAGPTGYFEFDNTRWANAAGAGVATAIKRTVAASEDPGAFTHAAEDNRAFTIAVRPAQPTPQALDFEAPNGTTVKYRVRSVHLYPTESTFSSWVESSNGSWSSTAAWLKHAHDPTLNMVVVVYSQVQRRRTVRRGVHAVLGRSDPVVTTDKRGPAEGELTLDVTTEEEQEALDALLETTSPLLLQMPADHHWPDRWIVLGDHDRSRIVDKLKVEDTHDTFPWTEVARPSGDLLAWPSITCP